MRELLAEVHHRPWAATVVAAVLAAFCAAAHLALLAALAAMAAGLVLMWISEEENKVVAAMGMAPVVTPTSAPAPPLAPALDPAPTPTLTTAPALPVPARGPVAAVREWASPFPAPRPARRPRPQGRHARRRPVAALVPSD